MTQECLMLHARIRKQPRFSVGFAKELLPTNGIYFLFEKGEHAHQGERIVRVGTHTGQNNLIKRINEHLYTPNKDRSIFRKHVGRCLLAKRSDPFLETWNIDLTKKAMREKFANKIDFSYQEKIEAEVTAYMRGAFSFSVLSVEKKKDRLWLEEKLISTLVQCSDCHASSSWLGKWHPNPKIALSGVWNIQGQDGAILSLEDVERLV